MRYVALIRGINVGGKNPIRMTELKVCFEEAGMRDVATYIQSGNVVFTAGAGPAEIARRLEAAIAGRFDCRTAVMLRTQKEMETIITRAPTGFGKQPGKFRYDVIFLGAPLTPKEAIEKVATKPGVDQARAGDGVLYFSRLIAKSSQSQLSRLMSLPIYKSMTIRNWRTTTTLLQMLAPAATAPAARGD
ncbi:MAG TPA: DUF1697 domain-containing protein [Polyangia bacterium]|nr:DUF1697 domain-containing protein [Polyangia bacterium]